MLQIFLFLFFLKTNIISGHMRLILISCNFYSLIFTEESKMMGGAGRGGKGRVRL